MTRVISPAYVHAKRHLLDLDRDELRAFITSPAFAQQPVLEQGFIMSQAGLMATLSDMMSVRLGAADKLALTHQDGVHPLHPVKPDHASAVLYPAIKAAMNELDQLPPAFNDVVNNAFNILWDAFWSETPAPRDVPQRRANIDWGETKICR